MSGDVPLEVHRTRKLIQVAAHRTSLKALVVDWDGIRRA